MTWSDWDFLDIIEEHRVVDPYERLLRAIVTQQPIDDMALAVRRGMVVAGVLQEDAFDDVGAWVGCFKRNAGGKSRYIRRGKLERREEVVDLINYWKGHIDKRLRDIVLGWTIDTMPNIPGNTGKRKEK